MSTIVLDNEAVRALIDPAHNKHRTVVSHVEGVRQRLRKHVRTTLVVPTSVRVEAGWDRSDPRAAMANRLGIGDHSLDSHAADQAASLATLHQASVADAHVGVAIQASADGRVVVVTSDPGDIKKVAGDQPVEIVRIWRWQLMAERLVPI